MSGYGMGGFAGQSFQHHTPFAATDLSNPMLAIAQGKQRAQDGVPQVDEGAFEQAFEQAHADMLEAEAEARGVEDIAPQSSQEDIPVEKEKEDVVMDRLMAQYPILDEILSQCRFSTFISSGYRLFRGLTEDSLPSCPW